MQTLVLPDPIRYRTMTTDQIRKSFLLDSLFRPGELDTFYLDVDRTIVGSAVPLLAPIILAAADELRALYFLERREIGILNIGGPGTVTVEGKEFPMQKLDCLYVGRGSREVSFTSADPNTPAQFYLLSYPAHTSYPTTLAKKSQAAAVPVGKQENLNQRTIYKVIHPEGVKSCQLVMGFTELAPGNAWNTMPPHTHTRRSEVYLYFNLDPAARVFHMMGLPEETRHLLVADKQAVVSPSWSIHAGVAISNYTFCWGMGGENQTFDDMDPVPIAFLK